MTEATLLRGSSPLVSCFCYSVDHNEVPINSQELSSDPVEQSGISPLGENSQEL